MTSPAKKPLIDHLPALDGLRGVAIALVVGFHLGLWPAGFLGVDVFFVLSGYLITRLLLAEHERSRTIDLTAFWARRARRLLPALLVLLALVTAFFARSAEREVLERMRFDALSAIAYFANWRSIVIGADYWNAFRARSPFEHVWSLAIEEQFYVAWPLVVAVLLKVTRKRGVVLAAIALAIASTVAMALLYRPNESTMRVYYGTDTRALALLAGAALATWSSRSNRVARIVIQALALVGVVVLVTMTFTLNGTSPVLYPVGFAVAALSSAAIIASIAAVPGGALARVLSFGPLRALGRISYGVYLWHWPIILATAPLADRSVALSRASAVVATLVVATISFVVIERPIRAGAFRGRPMVVIAPVALLATLGLVLACTAGGRARATPVALVRPASSGKDAPSKPNGDASPLTVLVVGDSVAHSLTTMKTESVRIENRGVEGCGLRRESHKERFLDGRIAGRSDCEDWAKRWPRDLEEVHPDVVVLVVTAPSLAEVEIGGQWLRACEPAFDDAYRGLLERAIDTLGAKGAAVLVATSPYTDAPSENTIPTKSGIHWRFVTNRARTDCVNTLIRATVRQKRNAEILDLAARMCPTTECVEREGDAILRPDGTHFSEPGGQLVLAWMETELARLPIADLRRRATE